MGNKNKLWIFGDSFVANNANWVHELAQKCDCKIGSLGYGGSSVQWLLLELFRLKPLIQPNDRVLIAITNSARFFLKSKHYHSLWSIEDELNLKYYLDKGYKQSEIDAVKAYLTQLYEPQQDKIYKGALVSTIVNNIFPEINTKFKQYFFTIDEEEYLNSRTIYVDRRKNEPYAFLTACKSFYNNNSSYFKQKGLNTYMDVIQDPPNHWIDHPDYHEYFWNMYGKHLEVLYRDAI